MSEEELRRQLESKQTYANELMKTLQVQIGETHKLIEERKVLNIRIEELTRALKKAEGRLEDRERDHRVLLESFQLIMRAYHEGADVIDEIEAALEIHDPPSSLRETIAKYRTMTTHARNASSDTYALRAQERFLLKLFKEGMTEETRAELHRFFGARLEYFRDTDHIVEAGELLKGTP